MMHRRTVMGGKWKGGRQSLNGWMDKDDKKQQGR